ncbi:uncharacterized protein LOC129715880 [Leucoraja erinacea]|uniref:uncharacterized protein LOC129715880 n=1 Tax=Leucoraja erinaceus TaxID=7782 RepID=UPI002453D8D8|nr:uncharacterized protein LOC129715880 [Leucoraja erinacea]
MRVEEIGSKVKSKSGRQTKPGQKSKRATFQHNCVRGKSVVKTSLKALCLNARSIRNKVDELNVQIAINDYDIVGITETWLQGDQGWELNIQGYSIFRRDRRKGKGGGVALLIREGINAMERKDISLEDVESVWVELHNTKGQKTLVGVVYRPPNSSSEVGDGIKQEIRNACDKGKTVIMGDFNLHIDWVNQIGRGAEEEDFLECMRDSYLNQHVEEPTREQAILDWVLSNEEGLVSNLVVRAPLGKSDHNMVEFFIRMESDIVNSETMVQNLKKGNFEGMRRELAKIDWQLILKGLTVDMQWKTFKDCMDELQKLFIPVWQKTKSGKVVHPWITREISDSIKAKDEVYKLARKSSIY